VATVTGPTGNDSVDIPSYARLLWGRADEDARPGPKRSVDAHAIGAAGMRLADAGGLAAVSMRSVAAEVGLTSMALYRYVGSKRELVLMVVDEAYGPPPRIVAGRRGWRTQMRDWAVANRSRLAAHPWVVAVPMGEPPLLPNSIRWLERALEAFATTPLSEQQKLSSVLLIDVYVRGQVALAAGFGDGDGPDIEAGQLYTRRLLTLADPDEFPRVHAALQSGALEDDNDFSADEFAFGLETVLDGISALVDRHRHRR
jgi:AcrR family transcriptional regulator